MCHQRSGWLYGPRQPGPARALPKRSHIREGLVTVRGRVLERRAATGEEWPEPSHQLLRARTGRRREGRTGVPQIGKVEIGPAHLGPRRDPGFSEQARRQRIVSLSDEEWRVGTRADIGGQVLDERSSDVGRDRAVSGTEELDVAGDLGTEPRCDRVEPRVDARIDGPADQPGQAGCFMDVRGTGHCGPLASRLRSTRPANAVRLILVVAQVRHGRYDGVVDVVGAGGAGGGRERSEVAGEPGEEPDN